MDNYEIANILSGRGWIAKEELNVAYARCFSESCEGSSWVLPLVVIDSNARDAQCEFYMHSYFRSYGKKPPFGSSNFTDDAFFQGGGDALTLDSQNYSVFINPSKRLYLHSERPTEAGELVTDFFNDSLCYAVRAEAFHEIRDLSCA